jgi:hypothetical protein
MTRIYYVLRIAFSAIHLVVVPVCVADPGTSAADWKERLYKEGPPAWEAWRQFNKHLDGVARVTEAGTVTNPSFTLPPKPRETVEWRFKFNGDWALQEQHVIETSDHGSSEDPRPARGAIAISSKYGFSVKQQTDDSPWIIRGVATRGYENLRAEFDEGVNYLLEAPWVFYYGYFPLPELLQQRGFKLRNCETVPRDGREHCKITFDYSPNSDKPEWTASMKDAWVVLDPESHWAIQEWEISEYVLNAQRGVPKKISMSVSGTNIYGDVSNGFPMLRETRQREASADGYVDSNVVFKELAYRDSIPEAEFGLTQYGLPEPFGPLASGKSARAPILIFAGLLALVVAGLLYYRVRNARAS